MTSAIRKPCLVFLARLTARSPRLSLTVPMSDLQPETFWRHALVRSSRSLFCLPRLPIASPQSTLKPSARNRHIAEISTRSRMAWRNPPATINAAGSRPRWADGRRSSGQNSMREASTIRRQNQRLASVLINQMTDLGRPEFKRVA